MRLLRVLALVLVLLVSFSCTVKQDLTIKSGKDGEIFIDLELNPVFVRYINDLSETTGKSAKSIETVPILSSIPDLQVLGL